MAAPLLLNCDLGESYGDRRVGLDEAVMPHIDQANIACGFHGGDPLTISDTIALAARCEVAVGAHPSYADLEGFGRRSIAMEPAHLVASLHYQIAALAGMADARGLVLAHVKPHGALYNDMMAKSKIRTAVITAVASYPAALTLVLQATPHWQDHAREAARAKVPVMFEAFADRRYEDTGLLQSRTEPGSVLNREDIEQQVRQLCAQSSVTTASGATLAVHAQTLCVHGDNAASVASIETIRALLGGD